MPNSFNLSLGKTFGREGAGFPGLSPMANIAYQWTNELMTYARASRGYQSGVAQDVVTDARLFTSTAPERLEGYEAGFKSQWLDNRLRLNADGFFSRYKDQVVSFQEFSPGGGLTSRNVNAGKSEYWGSEVELTAIPLRGLEAMLNYAYLSAKFLEYPQQTTVNGQTVIENVAEALAEVLRDQPFYETSGGGITLSGGEPLMQIDFSAALLDAARPAWLHTAVETCGFAPRDRIERILLDISAERANAPVPRASATPSPPRSRIEGMLCWRARHPGA